ncbi:MAG: GNAT family N-acetyltransferase [Pseudomonadota bacterium]
MLTIRSYDAEDEDALWSILEPVIRAGETYALPRNMQRAAAIAYWTGAPRDVLVAERGGAVLGTYFIRPNQPGGGDHVCNCGYATAEAAQGQGVARAMLAHSLERARAQGYAAMQYNFVITSNERAVATWQKAGFDTVGHLPGVFRHPRLGMVDALVMYRRL